MKKLTQPNRYWVIIPAAGQGLRMDHPIPKQYVHLLGKTLIEHAMTPFWGVTLLEKIVVVLAEHDAHWPVLPLAASKQILTTLGGKVRCQSVFNGLKAIARYAKASDWVIVHDAARPCLHPRDLNRLIEALSGDSVGGLLGRRVTDTIKTMNVSMKTINTVDRTHLWYAQTPQMFRFGLLYQALENVIAAGKKVTDEAQAIEYLGHKSRIIESRHANLKVTYPEDLSLIAHYLEKV